MIEPYYQEPGIQIYHGDCQELLPEMPSFDLVITSPPYNLGNSPWPHLGHWKPGDSPGGKSKWRNGSDASNGIQYQSHQDTMPWAQYVQWQQDILLAIWDQLPDYGAIFYNHKCRVIGGRLWTPLELIPSRMIPRQIITWARPGGMNFNPTAFVPTQEWILWLAKPDCRLKSKAVSGLGDVWWMAPDSNPHPAPFPLALPSRILEATKSRVVLDLFMGSGTTLVAAKNIGRSAVGIDNDESCCELAANRLRQTVLHFDPEPLTQEALTFDD
jgi:modification methylase